MTHEYAFDVKMWAVVRVKAENQKRAEEIVREFADCMDISLWADARNHDGLNGEEEIRFTEASAEGEPDLLEMDGEDL